MKVTKSKVITLILGLVLLIGLSITGLLNISTTNIIASADTIDATYDDFIITEYSENVAATYDFVRLNENECSVRISNKSEATKAIIPSLARIDGKIYNVTEVAANGFMSCPKLVKVSLPSTIKKIGSMAFANCSELQRISLANVEEIANSAFYRCSKLEKLVLPKSVETIGTNILRGNSTEVKVRAESDGINWASAWNSNNSKQEVEYNSKYIEPLELEPVYYTAEGASYSTLIGYGMASGQPRTDNFYVITEDNRDEYTDTDEYNNIFIPAQYNGIDILYIDEFAFGGAVAEQIIIEYSEKPIELSSNSFTGTECYSIVFNRGIEYTDEVNNIFTSSSVQFIVLPNTIESIADSMFNSCFNLTNIYFIKPKYIASRAEMLSIVANNYNEAEEGFVYLPDTSNFDTIGSNAFEESISITQLHIYGNVKNVAQSIVYGWDENIQTVFLHNEAPLPEYDYDTKTGWHPDWNKGFENIEHDNYFILLDAKGGSLSSDYVPVKENCEIVLPTPYYEGHHFEGWYKGDELYTETIFNDDKDVYLTAKWSVIIELVNQDGEVIETLYAFCGASMPIPEEDPTEIGYKFHGYYSEPNGKGTKYYNADLSSVYDYWEIDEGTTLYAYNELILYNITYIVFNQNDEQLSYGTVQQSYFDPIGLPMTYKRGYKFDGWYSGDKKIGLQEHTTASLVLTGTWRGIKATASTTTTKPILIGEYIVIELTQQFSTYCEINIPASTKYVYIYSNYNIDYKMYITFEKRTDDFELCLDNVSFTAPTLGYVPTNAIAGPEVMLNLYTYGTVNIRGSEGTEGNVGGRGISAACLTIWEASKGGLHIYGGKGGNGTANTNSVSAGAGGNGGEAIYAADIIIKTHYVYLTGGNGGNGGRGSSLVTSGNGGIGGKAYFGNLINELQFTVIIKNGTNGLNGYFT